ncbi:unnamed protein product [Brachionus calyciflorus]|uniref:Gag-like protein n=1 Tax=Brachionus calyciflorus TaxID=104777 RepID=A0A814ADR2_9BILA|nr:unnamed protein product [Brachionus calyciflorus]
MTLASGKIQKKIGKAKKEPTATKLTEEKLKRIHQHIDKEYMSYTARNPKKQKLSERKKEDMSNVEMTDQSTLQEDTIFRYYGENLNAFKNPIKLQEEIDKNIGLQNSSIKKAFINNKNGLLYIITDETNTIEHLQTYEWPKNSFITGINTATRKEKEEILAIKGFDLSIDISSDSFKINVMEKHNIFEAKRIFKKSEQRPLTVIRIKTKDENSARTLLQNGLKVGYTNYRVEIWKTEERPLQCRNCNKFNHHTKTCTIKKSCALCTGEHTMDECPNRNDQEKIKCTNCNQNHPAFSKKCQTMIDFVKKLKYKKEEAKETPQQTQTQHQNNHKALPKPTQNPETNNQMTYAAKTQTESKTPQNIPLKSTTKTQDDSKDLNQIIGNIIANLSIIITSGKLDMSNLVKINTVIENLSKRLQNENE